MSFSVKDRKGALSFLNDQMRQVNTIVQDEPRAQVRGASSEVEAHNGRRATSYEANQMLMDRLAHGFGKEDGPVVCVMSTRCKHVNTCGMRNGHSCYVKHSWVRDLFNDPPEFIGVPVEADVGEILSMSPAVVVAAEEYRLPRKVVGYIRVRLKAFRFQLLFKIKE